MIRVGIIGLGYWGPNLVRNFANLPESQITAICDRNSKRLKQLTAEYPKVKAETDADLVLNSNTMDAAVIATPTKTHYVLARKALEHGLHTFVEKPLATSPEECEDLIRLAEINGCILFVGHVFLYTAAIAKLKELITAGELGEVCYIRSARLNLGPIRQDVNALWDLAPHDISIILHLIDSAPVSLNCQGLAYLNKGVHDVFTLTVHFENGCMATVHGSWLDPNKIRRITVVGNEKMVVYDDIEVLEKIKIYDKGVDKPAYSDGFGEFQLSYRYGDIFIPRLEQMEPLKTESLHFIECVKNGKRPITDGQNGLEVVRVIHAADYSLHNGGGKVKLEKRQPRAAK